jgi:FtsZ-binding cell division protein ZapB
MARIFNSIRQRLLAQNRFTRYLIYAAGEILLVVIGILIALQLNLLKEERNQRRQEVQTLEQLRDEFTSNLKQLDEKISMREIMIRAALQLLAYHDDPTMIVPDSVETFIAQTTVGPTFDPVTNDLITSGRLYLISNLELRRKLSSWTSELVQVTEEEVAWIGINRNVYAPFLRAHYPMRNIHVAKWSGLDVVQTIMLDKTSAVNLDISRSKRSPDLSAFFAQPETEDLLSTVVSANLFANRQSEALRKSIVEILELIDAELKDN